MLAHMRKHHTKVSSSSIKPVIVKEEPTTPWREVAKEELEKYTESGQMLRGARFKNDLTQKQLAEKLGVMPHHISEMEHGRRTIGKAMARRLAEVLGVDYRVFL